MTPPHLPRLGRSPLPHGTKGWPLNTVKYTIFLN